MVHGGEFEGEAVLDGLGLLQPDQDVHPLYPGEYYLSGGDSYGQPCARLTNGAVFAHRCRSRRPG